MKKLLHILLFSLAVQPVFPQQRSEALDDLIKTFEKKDKAMGSIVIFKNGEPMYHNNFGYAVYPEIKPDSLTQYRIGSISKTFTAVVILQMMEEGKLKLDEPLSRFFPEWPKAAEITIEQLLRHQSGIENFAKSRRSEYRNLNPQTNKEIDAVFENSKPDFKPGSKAEYNNANYVALSLIAERIDSASFVRLIAHRITIPLKLNRTVYGQKVNSENNEAYAYKKQGGKWVQMREGDLESLKGAGAIVSTPMDLCWFYSALFDGKLIEKESLNEMMTMKKGFGLGLFQYPFYDKRAYGHGGSIGGLESFAAHFPEENVTIAICLNGGGEYLNDILKEALEIWFKKY